MKHKKDRSPGAMSERGEMPIEFLQFDQTLHDGFAQGTRSAGRKNGNVMPATSRRNSSSRSGRTQYVQTQTSRSSLLSVILLSCKQARLVFPTVTDFEEVLTGGHPNSLGRTVEVVDAVLADRSRLDGLYKCYFTSDEVVRLRVSSAMKRVTIEKPEWTMDFIEGLQSDIAAIDQASTQWTLALIFDLLADRLSPDQRSRAIDIMQGNLAHHADWIVLNNSMKVLGKWAKNDPDLARWLLPHAQRLVEDSRKSVASNAQKLLAQLRPT